MTGLVQVTGNAAVGRGQGGLGGWGIRMGVLVGAVGAVGGVVVD